MPAGAGQRPPPAGPQAPVPHQNIVLHGHPQPQLVPMMPNATHFQPQPANYTIQIPLQHQARPQLINGSNMPPGAQPNFPLPQPANPAHVAHQQAEHLRRLQQGGVAANPGLTQIPFQPQMGHVPNPQQLQQQLQLQQAQQMRLPHQAQLMRGQHMIQHPVNPNGPIPVANGSQAQLQILHL
jgi:hypothetical protein